MSIKLPTTPAPKVAAPVEAPSSEETVNPLAAIAAASGTTGVAITTTDTATAAATANPVAQPEAAPAAPKRELVPASELRVGDTIYFVGHPAVVVSSTNCRLGNGTFCRLKDGQLYERVEGLVVKSTSNIRSGRMTTASAYGG